MKNFFKFLGIISLVLVIGFSMAACSDDDDDDGDSSSSGGGSVLDWPDDIKALGDLRFQGASFSSTVAFIRFTGTGTDWEGKATPGKLTISNQRIILGDSYSATQDTHALVSVEGKTIKLNAGSGTKTLCTDYTITGEGNATKITLTGGDELYAAISGELSVF